MKIEELIEAWRVAARDIDKTSNHLEALATRDTLYSCAAALEEVMNESKPIGQASASELKEELRSRREDRITGSLTRFGIDEIERDLRARGINPHA